MKKINYILVLFLALVIAACSTVPITGRKQLSLVPESTVSQMALTTYKQFLAQNPPVPAGNADAAKVKRVGNRIASAVDKYLRDNNMNEMRRSLKWEFNLIRSKDVNAWALPGGKVVVYSGILPIAKDDAGLAVVMGHEIAHAIAKHGSERLSQQVALQGGGMTLAALTNQKPQLARSLFMNAYNVGATLGSLAYSRTHEYEADKLGMVFMAIAGYNPERAVSFWQTMQRQAKSAAPPEFISTHPAADNRIEAIRDFVPEANKYYRGR